MNFSSSWGCLFFKLLETNIYHLFISFYLFFFFLFLLILASSLDYFMKCQYKFSIYTHFWASQHQLWVLFLLSCLLFLSLFIWTFVYVLDPTLDLIIKENHFHKFMCWYCRLIYLNFYPEICQKCFDDFW